MDSWSLCARGECQKDEFRKVLAGEPTEMGELRGLSLAGLEKTIAS